MLRNIHNDRPVRVAWPLQDYVMGHHEARYALALNPCMLRRTPEATLVWARMEYLVDCPVVFMRFPINIHFNEGLFAYLQKQGWLHPYTVVWEAKTK